MIFFKFNGFDQSIAGSNQLNFNKNACCMFISLNAEHTHIEGSRVWVCHRRCHSPPLLYLATVSLPLFSEFILLLSFSSASFCFCFCPSLLLLLLCFCFFFELFLFLTFILCVCLALLLSLSFCIYLFFASSASSLPSFYFLI